MLEDLGFSKISPPPRDKEHQAMTYHCHTGHCYQRIYADINNIIVIELFLQRVTLTLDKWRLDQSGLYITMEDLDFDLRDPQSIDSASDYISEAVSMYSE